MEKFKKCKKILMAFNLIEKRIDKHDANTCFLVLQEPLSFNEFISSEKRRKILVEKIGNEKYEEISYFFNNTNYLVTSEAVAEVGIDDIFGEITKNEGNININDLYAEVCKKVHNFTNFSEECKKMIINHSSDNLNFTINNYLPIVIESIVEKDNKKILSEFLLKRKLSIKDDAQIDLKKTIKKNQSEENFAISILKDGFGEDKIYEEYKAEQFFFKLLGDINEETANFFKTCREKYSLSDGIINLIINYVVINNKNFFGNQ
jgi:replication initiation and membrane attachment protein DnaB